MPRIADQLGYSASEGFAVTFVEGGRTTPSLESVLSGKARFGIAAQPDLTLRFVPVKLKGWTNAIENPAEIGQMVLKFNPPADSKLEIEKMTPNIPLVNTGNDHRGWVKPEIWTGMEQV